MKNVILFMVGVFSFSAAAGSFDLVDGASLRVAVGQGDAFVAWMMCSLGEGAACR